jgi:RHS repeat-associated protein
MDHPMKNLKLTLSTGLMFFMLSGAHAAQTERAHTVALRYDLSGQVTGAISPDPDAGGSLHYFAIRNTYDTRGLLTKTETGELSAWLDETVEPKDWANYATYSIHKTQEFTYDDNGFKIKGVLRGTDGSIEAVVQYSYNAQNLVACRAERMNPATFGSPPSDACALGAEGALGPDRVSRFTYNGFDQVLTEERAVGVPGQQQTYLTNTYAGRLPTSQTDANGNRTETRYDAYGQIRRRVYASPTTPGSVNESDYNEYTYDKAGVLKIERKRSGETITYTPDGLGRPIVKDLSNNTYAQDVYFDYDLRGLVRYSRFGSDSGEGETVTYTGFGDVETRSNNVGGSALTLGYSYDEDSNRTRITYPDGYFYQSGFDGLDRLNQLSESVSATPTAAVTSLVTVGYGADAKRLNIVRTGVATTWYTRDNARRLDSFVQDFAGTANDLTNVFTYNPAGQVRSLMQSNSQYTYSEYANKTGPYVPNGLNQYAFINGQPVGYDTNGNLTSDGELTYTYDMENHLVAASGTVNGVAVSATLTSDPMGRLSSLTVGGVTTRFVYDGDSLVAEYVGTTMTRRYVSGGLDDEPWIQYNDASVGIAGRKFLFADHLGSVIAQTDGAGAIQKKLSYDSYGIPLSTNADRFGYTGQIWFKELGLNYFKARVYSPRLGRFLQTDPIFFTDDMNLYAYVAGDPLSRIDPLGLSGTLTIASRSDGGDSSVNTSGHSWIIYTDDATGTRTTYGTYGNNPEDAGEGGHKKGLFENVEGGMRGHATRTAHLSDAEEAKLKKLLDKYRQKGEKGWKLLAPCSTFARDAWQAGTGESLSSGHPSTPTNLMQSIIKANGGSKHGRVIIELVPPPPPPPTTPEDPAGGDSPSSKTCTKDEGETSCT